MRRRYPYWLASVVLIAAVPLLAANETINYVDINKIKAEGLSLQRSQVMDLNSWLSDVFAPRLTGSPTAMTAAEWTVAKLKEWGLVNVAIEPWQNTNGFERGWTNDKFYMAALTPQGKIPIPGTPTAWTPGTTGMQSADVVLVVATTQDELAQYKGKLKGKWVMIQAIPDVAAYWDAPAKRYTPEQLATLELAQAPQPEFGVTPPGGLAPQGQRGGAPAAAPAAPAVPAAGAQAAAQASRPGTPAAAGAPQPPMGGRGGFGNVIAEFCKAEGAFGTIATAPRGHGIYTIGGNRANDPATTLPAVVIAAEQYGRIGRLLAKKVPVTIEAEITNTFYPTPKVFNIVGEIPGTDRADEIVMLGGHFDTWHVATGAADNGVGVAAMMEAMRILKATGVKLRRTVRIGLWEGEEQGLIGSREYVAAHFASRQAAPAQAGAPAGGGGRGGFGGPQGPLEQKPDYNKLSAYFNIDNGTGALRGIYLQGNDAVAPIFREWVEPFRSLGFTTLTIRNTGGTDHQSFDGVGLPGFQFIQDEVEYNTMIHHTNLDTYERLQPADCRQMATIVAGFAYLTANRDEKLPRKPLPVPGQGGGR